MIFSEWCDKGRGTRWSFRKREMSPDWVDEDLIAFSPQNILLWKISNIQKILKRIACEFSHTYHWGSTINISFCLITYLRIPLFLSLSIHLSIHPPIHPPTHLFTYPSIKFFFWGNSLAVQWLATHSSILAWRIPWTEEPGGLQSIGSHRVGHDRSNLACMPAQRLALSGFTAAVLGSIPGWELRSCKPHGMDKTKKQTKRERILKPFQGKLQTLA